MPIPPPESPSEPPTAPKPHTAGSQPLASPIEQCCSAHFLHTPKPETLSLELSSHGTGRRVDPLLEKDYGERACVEVKNTTLAEGTLARFPGAVTTRGKKHLEELEKVVAEGHRGVMLFCVSREDVDAFSPADDIDPGCSQTLRRVAKNGVKRLAYATKVTPTSLELAHRLEIRLLETKARQLRVDRSIHISGTGSSGRW